MKKINLDLVIPFRNEKKNLELFFVKFKNNLKNFKHNKININLVFIDDFSIDKGSLIVHKNSKINKNILLIKNKKNYGSHFSSLLGLTYCRGDISLFFWSDLEMNIKEIFRIVKKYRENKRSILISYKNKYAAKDTVLPNIFWNLFGIFHGVKIVNFFSFLIDKNTRKKLNKKIYLNEILFNKFADQINYFDNLIVSTDARKHGLSKWNFYKKIQLFYNSLVFRCVHIKILVFSTILVLSYLQNFFIILFFILLIIEIRMKLISYKKPSYSVKIF